MGDSQRERKSSLEGMTYNRTPQEYVIKERIRNPTVSKAKIGNPDPDPNTYKAGQYLYENYKRADNTGIKQADALRPCIIIKLKRTNSQAQKPIRFRYRTK
jgi:hypothetical protein